MWCCSLFIRSFVRFFFFAFSSFFSFGFAWFRLRQLLFSRAVVYHVATHMPSLDSDPHRTNKKRHIGNDRVHIVFDESGTQYNPDSFVV
jgi:hypothetical protein